MKNYLIIISTFFCSCISSYDKETTDSSRRPKPLSSFKIVINWSIADSIPYKERVFGPATLKLIRISDNKIFEMSLGTFSLTDSTYSKIVYQKATNQSLPFKILNENFSGLYLKDINFDNVPELIVESDAYDKETFEKSNTYNIFEIKEHGIERIDYFPTQALERSGEIDKNKKEVSVTNYLNCCSYITYVYKFNNNSKEKFVIYKEEEVHIDPITNDEEIIVKEEGKRDLKIFKKSK